VTKKATNERIVARRFTDLFSDWSTAVRQSAPGWGTKCGTSSASFPKNAVSRAFLGLIGGA